MSHGDDLGHGDIEAALAARRELGARYDAELVDGFAERIERAVERRAAERGELQQRRTAGPRAVRIRQFVLGLISVGVGIPITHRADGRHGQRAARAHRGLAGHRGGQRRPRIDAQRSAPPRLTRRDTPPEELPQCAAGTRLTGCEPF